MPKPGIFVKEIIFSGVGETSLKLEPNDVVVFVGPNNCGKTTSLEEILCCGSQNKHSRELLAVKGVSFKKIDANSTAKDFTDIIICKHATPVPHDRNQYQFINSKWGNSNTTLEDWGNRWANCGTNYYLDISSLAWIFTHQVTTADRLSNLPDSVRKTVKGDQGLEERVSDKFTQIFGQHLRMDRYISDAMKVGLINEPLKTAKEEELGQQNPNAQQQILEEFTTLEDQGDGMKSSARIIMELWTSPFKTMFFIDEPEAFLHPPQAKKLGKLLVKERPEGQQLFVATHSTDFLKGVMEVKNAHVHIVRLVRDREGILKASICSDEALKKLLNQGFLKYSNAIDSLFYPETVLCEGHADAMFYSAVLDSCAWTDEKPEAFFLPCGGKEMFKKVSDHLIKLGVRCKIIADIDIIDFDGDPEKSNISILFNTLGGDYSEIKDSHEKLVEFIKSNIEPNPSDILRGILEGSNKLDRDSIEKITQKTEKKKIIKKKYNQYRKMQVEGKKFFKEIEKDFHFLSKKCAEKGLFIVPVGELESWCKEGSNKSERWVSDVLEKVTDFSSDSRLQEARDFIKAAFER